MSSWSFVEREGVRLACLDFGGDTAAASAGQGIIPAADARTMIERLPHARLAELPGAGHDLHLDRPADWRRALDELL